MRFWDTSSWTALTTNSSILIGQNTLLVSFLNDKIGIKINLYERNHTANFWTNQKCGICCQYLHVWRAYPVLGDMLSRCWPPVQRVSTISNIVKIITNTSKTTKCMCQKFSIFCLLKRKEGLSFQKRCFPTCDNLTHLIKKGLNVIANFTFLSWTRIFNYW